MNELTIILFVITLAIYVISLIVKKNDLNWMATFLAIISIAQTVLDESVASPENILLIAPMFYVMLISGVTAMRGE